jgi:hypothetical protein
MTPRYSDRSRSTRPQCRDPGGNPARRRGTRTRIWVARTLAVPLTVMRFRPGWPEGYGYLQQGRRSSTRSRLRCGNPPTSLHRALVLLRRSRQNEATGSPKQRHAGEGQCRRFSRVEPALQAYLRCADRAWRRRERREGYRKYCKRMSRQWRSLHPAPELSAADVTGTPLPERSGTLSVTVARNEGTPFALAADTTQSGKRPRVCTEGPETRIEGVPVAGIAGPGRVPSICHSLTPARLQRASTTTTVQIPPRRVSLTSRRRP